MLPRDYPVDGQDIRPWLTQSAIDLDRPLYFHYPHVWGPEGPGYQPHSAAVFGKWKVIHYYNDNSWELYNLKEDLGEKDNLAKAQPERLANLAARLHEHLTELGAQWPVLREGGAEVPMKLPGLLKDNTQR
jgi:arylsulfatase A-like enzyme